jgi:propionate CoA-transferase
VTERCVFRLGREALQLIEVAPGVDIERDILDRLPFEPMIDDPKPMEAALFQPERLNLRKRFLDIRIEDRLSYDPDMNTVYMDYSGMRVRTEKDLNDIKVEVDSLLGPLGKRVNSIVNYERFEADPEIMSQYLDLVKYVEDRYYIRVSRYTTSGFMRLKLAQGLDKRHVTSEIYETPKQARNHIAEKD